MSGDERLGRIRELVAEDRSNAGTPAGQPHTLTGGPLPVKNDTALIQNKKGS